MQQHQQRTSRARGLGGWVGYIGLIAGGGLSLAALGALSACGGEPEPTSQAESSVWRDGDDWEDDAGTHPQVIRIMGSGRCTAWLSSSNTLTTNAHCLANSSDFIGWTFDPTQDNASAAQRAALLAMGPSIGGVIHPLGGSCVDQGSDCCWGADLAVLFFNPARAVPRNVMRPLAIKAATSDEPECDGDDRCVIMVGTGRTEEATCLAEGPVNAPVDSGATRLFLESGLGDGHCSANGAMLYGEYDFDDSSACKGDSGSPIFWGATDQVMAVARGTGGDIPGDDVVGPVLWKGGPNTARDFYFAVAGDQDADGIQAAYDNCDRTPNPGQEDFNSDTIGDACQDSDGDGLLDAAEIAIGTDPANPDTDGDGLADGVEVNVHGTDPKNSDTDGDGLSDGAEIMIHHTDPLAADTDGDWLTDGQEVLIVGTNPLVQDTDGDGLTDGQEVLLYSTNPLVQDTDGDGLTDGQEVLIHGTDPNDKDTDDDLLGDGFEVTHALDPLDADMDDDGVIDGQDPDWIANAITALPDAAFKAPGQRRSIAAHLDQIEWFAQHGELGKALAHVDTLRTHLDGCGAAPDGDDWLISCAAQLEIRALLDLLAANL